MADLGTLDGQVPRVFDDTQAYETVLPYACMGFLEDFLGAGHGAIPSAGSPSVGYPWVKKIVGAGPPTLAVVANAACGVVAAALAATSEKEEATIYWNDGVAVDVTKKPQIEFRAALTVPPSAAGVQSVWGLSSAWIDGPDNATRLIEFGVTANNGLICRMTDTAGLVTKNAAYLYSASTQVALDTNFHIFRIDMTNIADIGFYVDGARVNAVNSFAFTTTGANAIMQPYASVYKPSGTGLATLQIDKIDVWSQRA